METLKEKTAKGLFWGGMNNGVQQIVGVVFGILLARLLNAGDYGMMAMISVFSLVATALQNSGFATALANLKPPRDEDYNSVFWFNIIVGGSLYVILFFCAPLIAKFYHTPELIPLCRYAFLSIVIASLGTAQSAYLFKNLMVKQQAKAGMTAVLLSSATGAVMAWQGFAYWSLATQGLVFVGINTIMVWSYSPWRPMLCIDLRPAMRMFRFSCKILATTIVNHINNNVLNILLGHLFSKRDAGYYYQAYQWNFKCFSLVQGMVNQVVQPVLVDLNDDRGRQMNAFRKMVRFTAFISFPLLFGFALVSEEFIVIAITDKWIESAHLLQLLCISGAVMPISTVLSNMIISKGRSDIYLRCTLGLAILQILSMVVMSRWGIRHMVEGYVVINILWILVWHLYTRRLSGYRLSHFLADTSPFALAAAGVMTLTYLLTLGISNLYLLLPARIAIAVILYYAVMRIAHVRILDECVEFAMGKLRKKNK